MERDPGVLEALLPPRAVDMACFKNPLQLPSNCKKNVGKECQTAHRLNNTNSGLKEDE